MRCAVRLIRKLGSARPWLLAGKGPSFDRYKDLDPKAWYIFGLNDVLRFLPVTVAHFTDLRAYERNRGTVMAASCQVVLPWHPHVAHRPGKQDLATLTETDSDLGQLATDGRLASYNSSLDRRPSGLLRRVEVRYFSAVAAVNLLAVAGVRRIRAIGIDGGSDYSSLFDLGPLHANGRTDFDIQFREIDRAVRRYDLDYLTL